MWTADRDTVRPGATDEDRAMAHVNYGTRHVDRDDARSALIKGIKDELQTLVDRAGLCLNSKSILRLATILDTLLQNPELDSVERDGLRFQIREWGVKVETR
jgi:hypothetical protein